jgi:Zn finger protein HypA/HybF involved in hydrogenase expression
MTTNTGKKPVSWGWIIVCLFLFWPVGLFLLIKRLAVDKSATLSRGKTIMVVSYILMGLGVFYFFMVITGNVEETESTMSAISYAFLMLVLFSGGGVLLNWFARKTKRAGERYKKYITLIVNQSQTLIDNIASAVGIPYDLAVKDLQKMIDMGYFIGAYIDVNQREIVLAKTAPPQTLTQSASPAIPIQEKVVACSNCGANNKVTGQIGECEYCGSPLQ